MSVRVAMPLFGNEVAPRFCFTPRMLMADLEDGVTARQDFIDVAGLRWMERLDLLVQRDVQLLICGGFNRRFLPYAQELGLHVLWGHAGPAEEILKSLAGDSLESMIESSSRAPAVLPECGPSRGMGRGSRRQARRGKGRRRSR